MTLSHTSNFRLLVLLTCRNEVVAKVMFLLVSVILLTWGVSASVHADTPPGADAPLPLASRLWHTVNERSVRILLECILVCFIIDIHFPRNYYCSACCHTTLRLSPRKNSTTVNSTTTELKLLSLTWTSKENKNNHSLHSQNIQTT